MPADIGQVIKIGPAKAEFNGTDLGHMSVKGATAKWMPKTTYAKVAKYGDTAVKTFFTGGELTVEFELAQTDFALFAKSQIATEFAAAPGPGVGFGGLGGRILTPFELVLTPENAGTVAFKLTVPRAVAIGEPEIMYSSEAEENVYKVKFKALADESAAAGQQLAVWGA